MILVPLLFTSSYFNNFQLWVAINKEMSMSYKSHLSVGSRIADTEIFLFFHPVLPYRVYSSNFCYLYASFLEGPIKTIWKLVGRNVLSEGVYTPQNLSTKMYPISYLISNSTVNLSLPLKFLWWGICHTVNGNKYIKVTGLILYMQELVTASDDGIMKFVKQLGTPGGKTV